MDLKGGRTPVKRDHSKAIVAKETVRDNIIVSKIVIEIISKRISTR